MTTHNLTLQMMRQAFRLMRPHLGAVPTLTAAQCAMLVYDLGDDESPADSITAEQVASAIEIPVADVNRLVRAMQEPISGEPSAPLVRHHQPDGGRANATTPIYATEHARVVFRQIEAIFAEGVMSK